ncbi:MAG: carboxypeptidase-like regulatory domain-containing protein, partial [Prolixibacteraceae bacterium]
MSYRRTKNSWQVFFPVLLLTLLICFTTSAQKVLITGKVVNASDLSPLPFVYLRFDGGNNGTTSNIDGKFTLPDSVRQIQFSYIGFKSITLPVNKTKDHEWLVSLYPDDILLSTIEVHPRKDPAYRIIQSVLDHADENDPDKLESFEYTSYHKFWLSADDPSKSKLTGKMRISPRELERLQQKFEENHMLLIETLSKKKFLQPAHENEEILSTR